MAGRRNSREEQGGQLRGYVVRAVGKDDDWSIRRADGGCTLVRNHDSTGGNTFNHSHVNSDLLRKAGRGDWANLSGRTKTADVGSTTLAKSFLKGTSIVDRSRVPAPRLDSLRTTERIGYLIRWVGSHLFLCYRMEVWIDRNYYGSSWIHKSHWFPHGSGAISL